MDAGESSDARRSRLPGFGYLFWLFILVLVIYPLSVGPVAKVVDVVDNSTLESVCEVLYAPLAYLCDKVPWVDDFYEWYLPLWGVR